MKLNKIKLRKAIHYRQPLLIKLEDFDVTVNRSGYGWWGEVYIQCKKINSRTATFYISYVEFFRPNRQTINIRNGKTWLSQGYVRKQELMKHYKFLFADGEWRTIEDAQNKN